MEGLVDRTTECFAGFGRSEIIEPLSESFSIELDGEADVDRARIRRLTPDRPGVYGVVDRNQRLVYVGTSGRLRSRVSSYFAPSAPRKSVRVVEHAVRIHLEPADDPFLAGLRELELIHRFRPILNVRSHPDRMRCGFLYLPDERAASFRFARRVPKTARRWWGPVNGSRRTREAVDRLNLVFGLRDCSSRVPIRFLDQHLLFADDSSPHCLRGHTGSCLSPCSGGCTASDYTGQLQQATAFLGGCDDQLGLLRSQMQAAAGQFKFERAARLRDHVKALEYLRTQLAFLDFAKALPAGVAELHSENRCWRVIIVGGRVVRAVHSPHGNVEYRSSRSWRDHLRQERPIVPVTNATQLELLRFTRSWLDQHGPQRIIPFDDAP